MKQNACLQWFCEKVVNVASVRKVQKIRTLNIYKPIIYVNIISYFVDKTAISNAAVKYLHFLKRLDVISANFYAKVKL